MIAALLLPALLAGIIEGFLSFLPGSASVAGWLAMLFTPVLFIALALYRIGRTEGRAGLLAGAGRTAHLVAGFGVGLLGFVSNGVLAQVSLRFLAVLLGPEAAQAVFEAELQRAAPLVSGGPLFQAAVFVLLAVVTPFAEELFFRGYVYRGLRHHWGVPAAAVLSAFIFSAFHFYLVQALPIFAAGLLFALLYERTGSLLAPMVAHGVINAAVVLLMYASG